MKMPRVWAASWMTAGPKLLPMAMSGTVILRQLGSVLMSVGPVSTGAHVNHLLNYMLKYEGHAGWSLPSLALPLMGELPLPNTHIHLGKLAPPFTMSVGELALPLI